jgi:hypothetical protein
MIRLSSQWQRNLVSTLPVYLIFFAAACSGGKSVEMFLPEEVWA